MQRNIRDRREMAKFVMKGFCVGAADVVPGVGGATMALILGIYPRLLSAIKSFDGRWLRRVFKLDFKGVISYPDLPFLVPLFTGVLLALMFFTRVVSLPHLIETQPELIYALFFGLIVGSIVVLLKGLTPFGITEACVLALGVFLGFTVVTLVPTTTPETAWFTFLCGFLAIIAMLLPGISGSFILLILGKYAYVFDAIGRFDFSILIPFGLGVVTGLALFSRMLAWLLKTFHKGAMLIISGLLIGTLWEIWPFQERVYEQIRGKMHLVQSSPILPETLNSIAFSAFALAAAGIIFVITLDFLAHRKRTYRFDLIP